MTRYLIDTNTLTKMSEAQRSSDFVTQHCQIPSEILWEARGLRDHTALSRLEYPMNAEVLDSLRTIMTAVVVEEKLVDLYSNTGNGDVVLLAVASVENLRAQQELFGDIWVIATDDEGLIEKAAHFSLPICRSAEFVNLLD